MDGRRTDGGMDGALLFTAGYQRKHVPPLNHSIDMLLIHNALNYLFK